MSTQSALALTEIGKPLAKITLPIPNNELKDHELLVKITAAGLAPLDQKFRDKGHLGIGSRLPAVISGDIVGEIVKKGPSSTFQIGDHVFSQMVFSLNQAGGLQEYTILNGEYAAVVPAGIPDTEAALYPINLVTAVMSFFSAAGFGLPLPETPDATGFDYLSQKVVIIGGGSNIGKLSVQLARFAGFGTIITVASASSAELLKSLGATHAIARQDVNIEAQVRAIVGDDLLYVYDTFTFGDLSLGASLLSNSKKGIFVYNGTGQIPEAILEKKTAGLEEKRILGFSHFIPEFGRLFWGKISGWLAEGKIKPLAYKTIEGLDADKVNFALDEYAAGRSGERYHIRIA
ncbi:Dehydrogenase [Penicillium hispanicum]|uniref:Dehydrogenase n=1 Tax=Penicillium hispanicum TaxID=1080232 RepID=UPI002540D401|nr:Dehydrogenase [Penicillium hispanicum]KAJ5570177.1 Dehydrogenase [Penicillium hispanicum]